MNCMRCGQEISSGQVFCEECLAHMQKHPINPNTPVHLPRQRDVVPVKKPVKKRTPSMEEQNRTLRKRLRFFVIWCLVSTALVLAMLYPAIRFLMMDHFKPGQNYSSITSVETVETMPS